MKNAINYYYNLNAADIHQNNNQYRFIADGNNYCLTPFTRNISDAQSIYELSNNLIQRGLFVHQIIPDNNHNLVAVINNIPYIMLKVYINEKQVVTMKDIENFTNNTIGINTKIQNTSDWADLWYKKIDYLEYQMSEMGANHPLVRESFSYFVGLGETAIQLFNQISKKNNYSLNHFRITAFNNLFDFYNPLNLIIDYKFRDACEYLKYGFYYMNYELEDIKDYLLTIDIQDWPIFMTRMLFPTYYFDIFEEIINNNIEDKRLMMIISKIGSFERMLKQLYLYISKNIALPDIWWLIKT